jgi:hypothetical protein
VSGKIPTPSLINQAATPQSWPRGESSAYTLLLSNIISILLESNDASGPSYT